MEPSLEHLVMATKADVAERLALCQPGKLDAVLACVATARDAGSTDDDPGSEQLVLAFRVLRNVCAGTGTRAHTAVQPAVETALVKVTQASASDAVVRAAGQFLANWSVANATGVATAAVRTLSELVPAAIRRSPACAVPVLLFAGNCTAADNAVAVERVRDAHVDSRCLETVVAAFASQMHEQGDTDLQHAMLVLSRRLIVLGAATRLLASYPLDAYQQTLSLLRLVDAVAKTVRISTTSTASGDSSGDNDDDDATVLLHAAFLSLLAQRCQQWYPLSGRRDPHQPGEIPYSSVPRDAHACTSYALVLLAAATAMDDKGRSAAAATGSRTHVALAAADAADSAGLRDPAFLTWLAAMLAVPWSTLDPDAAGAQYDHMLGMATDVMNILANVAHTSPRAQATLQGHGVIPMILNATNIDDRQPYLKEMAILALRNMCEGNTDVQAEVDGYRATGIAASDEMRRMGLDVSLAGGKLNIKRVDDDV